MKPTTYFQPKGIMMNQVSLSLIKCATILALTMSACSVLPQGSTASTITPMPSGMVDVGGYELYFQCSGQGNPTVILESGGGADSTYWAAVIDGIEDTTRVCSYDRASLGRSDSVPGPRTFQDMTRVLQVLLENAHIGGPYILVGWSMGGMLVRVFADQHPGDVAGIVLVDSAHPDMGLRLLACLPPESADEPANIQFLRQFFAWMSNSNGSSFMNVEGVDTQASDQQVRDAGPLEDIPLVVISQGANIPGLGLSMITSQGPLPAEIDACLQQTWQDMQSELAELSSNTTRLTAQGGHMIPIEQPELIVQAIAELVERGR
jgi:pimeloyl-ACP methyl ester carboxylesterase